MFFFKASKRTENKNKNRQNSYVKLKSVHKKGNIQQSAKTACRIEKIFIMHTSDKELIFKTQEEFQKLSRKIKKLLKNKH